MGHRTGRWALAALLCAWAGAAAALDVALQLTGETDLEDDVRAAALLLGPEDDRPTAPQDVIAAARADYTRIVGRLYARGYYSPVVSIRIDGREAANIAPLDAPRAVGRVAIRVETGEQFRFGRASVAPLAPGTEIPPSFAPGEEAATAPVREAAAAAVEGWRETGRAKAEIGEQRIVARHPDRQLDVDLMVRPGPVVRFGRLTIPNPSAVRESRIRAIAGIPEGEVFDPEEIEQAVTRLRRTGAFSAVAMVEGDLEMGDRLPLELTLSDARPRRIGFGAEVNSSTGASLQGYWMHRNLFGGAERLRFDAEIGGLGTRVSGDGEDYSLSVLFRRPATFRADTDLSLRAGIVDEDEPNFDSERITAEATFTRYAGASLILEAGIALRIEETTDALGTRRFEQFSLPLRAEVERRDDPLDPKTGWYGELAVRPFYSFGDGDDGVRAALDLRGYRAFGADERTVAAARVRLGTVWGASRIGTPPEYLFFSGGGGTVRGQPFESLGVEDAGGTVGGRSTVIVQSEIRREITERIGAVGFVDFGFVGEDAFGGSGDTHAGAGLGVRYKTGFGPIRLDLAAPVSGDTGSGVQLYIGIGQAF